MDQDFSGRLVGEALIAIDRGALVIGGKTGLIASASYTAVGRYQIKLRPPGYAMGTLAGQPFPIPTVYVQCLGGAGCILLNYASPDTTTFNLFVVDSKTQLDADPSGFQIMIRNTAERLI